MVSVIRRCMAAIGCMLVVTCGAPPAPIAPATVTPLPPTATLPPATVTPLPPTVTLPPPTATSVPEVCRARPIATGKAPGSNENQPGGNRLRIARSDEMKAWQMDAGSVIDQAATPSLTISPSGMPLLYMTAHAINGTQDGFAVSVGDAEGRTWRHCYAERVNFPAGFMGVDPDVVRVADQQYRIYLTGGLRKGERKLGIHYADSTDGITWQYGGIAFESDDSVIDSMTFKLGDTWHMYVLPIDGIDMIHATSTDGISFVKESRANRLIAGRPHVLSQALVETSDATSAVVLAFEPPGRGVVMAFTSDGTTFRSAPDPINPIIDVADGDERFTRDPAILYFGRNSGMNYPYLVVYATAIP